jgi:histone acetyltransferase MYST1
MFSRKSELRRFQSRLQPHMRHPPGNEIYRCGKLSMFEVDGQEERIYCQNLSYIAKLFLDHKTLYFDVDPFLFYVLCEVDDRGFHPVGYFSKEKYSVSSLAATRACLCRCHPSYFVPSTLHGQDVGYNLSCIMALPSHQRKGYGRFLISFSYELSKKEEKVGSPEKPMSDLGQQAYKPYWASTIVDFLLHQSSESKLSIMDIAKKTSIMAEDIVFTLNNLGILKIINGVYFIAAEKTLLERLALRYPVKEPRVDSSKLHWTPYLTDVKRDKFSIHSKKASVEVEEKKSG